MKKNTGFTLIEILATITIIGILFTIGIVSYTNFNRKQMVAQSAKNIINTLRLAQSKALNGEKDTAAAKCGTGTSSITLDAWFFSLPSNTSYEIKGRCGANDFYSEPFPLPAGSSIRYSLTPVSPTPAGPIKFYPVTGGTSGKYTICVSWLNEPTYTYKISVEKMGEINDVGFTTCP